MKTLDLSQATAAVESGGVLSAVLKGKGAAFFIEFETRAGSAELVTANGRKPRAFRNPVKALELVRELGLPGGRFLLQEWRPEEAEFDTSRRRPERSISLKAAHEAAAYKGWLTKEVQDAIDDPRPSVPHSEVAAEWATERAALTKQAKRKGS
jgi:hypothetical protein